MNIPTDHTLQPDEATDRRVLGGDDDATYDPPERSLGAEDTAFRADGSVAPDDLRRREARRHAERRPDRATGPGLIEDETGGLAASAGNADESPEADAISIVENDTISIVEDEATR